jgi:hypothetical protein
VGWRFAVDETQFFDPFLSPGFRVQDAGNRAVYHYVISDITDAGTIFPFVYSFDATGRYLAVLYFLGTPDKYLARLYYLGETTLAGTAISPSDQEYNLDATMVHGALSDVDSAWTPQPPNDSAVGQWIDVFATKEGRLYVLEFTEELDGAVEHDYFRIRQITGSSVSTRAQIEIPGNQNGIFLQGGVGNQAMFDPQLGYTLMSRTAAHEEGPEGTPDILNLPLVNPIYHDTTETDLTAGATAAVRGGGKSLTATTIQMNDATNQKQKMIRRLAGAFATLTSVNSRQDLNAVPRPASAMFSNTLGHFLTDGFGEVRSFEVSGANFTVEADSAEIITPQSVSPQVNELFHYIRVVTTQPTEGQTFTIGAIVYTFRATLGAAYDVKIGATSAISNANLYKAIGDTGTPGTDYGIGTVAHPDVEQVTQGGSIFIVKSNGNSDVHISFSTNVGGSLSNYRLPGGVGVNCWRQLPGDFLQGFSNTATAFGVRAELQP